MTQLEKWNQALPLNHLLFNISPNWKIVVKAHTHQDEIIFKARQYIVQLLKPNSTCTAMDDLRNDLHSLPPTSADLQVLIRKCVYTTYIQTNCLQTITVDPTNYGYDDKTGSLVTTHYANNVSMCIVQNAVVNVLIQVLCMQKYWCSLLRLLQM